MELEATTLGRHLAQHPHGRAVILNTGTKISSDRHEYLIPFNQLLAVHCKCGLVWDELEFVLPNEKVVRLYGIEWGETQRSYHHLDAYWRRWSGEVSEIASGAPHQQPDLVATHTGENKWLIREQISGVQQQIRQALLALSLPANRPEEFDNRHEARHKCQAWLKDIESAQLQHNQTYTEAIFTECVDSFRQVKSSSSNPAQVRAVVNDEHSLLVLVSTGSGKTPVPVARTDWLLACDEASPEQISLPTFGRRAAEEIDERIRGRLYTEDIITRTFHALASYIIQQGNKKVPIVSELENDTAARYELFIAE